MADPSLRNGLSIGTGAYDLAGNYIPGSTERANRPAETIVGERARESSTINTYNLGTNPKYYVYMTCENYSRQSAMKLAVTNITDEIILPMPKQLIDSQRVQYTQEELTPLGGAAVNAINNNTLNNIRDAFVGVNGQGGSYTAAMGAAAGVAAGAVGSQAVQAGIAGGLSSLPTAVRNPIQAIAGMAPNQFMVILLKGPTYKKFQMEWTISPKSPEQARALNNTMKMIKNAQAPSLWMGSSYFFAFPKIFRIYLKPADEFLYQFKPCVLEDAQFNYTGSGMFAPTRLGAPETMKIVLSFMEMEFFLQGDYK